MNEKENKYDWSLATLKAGTGINVVDPGRTMLVDTTNLPNYTTGINYLGAWPHATFSPLTTTTTNTTGYSSTINLDYESFRENMGDSVAGIINIIDRIKTSGGSSLVNLYIGIIDAAYNQTKPYTVITNNLLTVINTEKFIKGFEKVQSKLGLKKQIEMTEEIKNLHSLIYVEWEALNRDVSKLNLKNKDKAELEDILTKLKTITMSFKLLFKENPEVNLGLSLLASEFGEDITKK